MGTSVQEQSLTTGAMPGTKRNSLARNSYSLLLHPCQNPQLGCEASFPPFPKKLKLPASFRLPYPEAILQPPFKKILPAW